MGAATTDGGESDAEEVSAAETGATATTA
jgi:hypothetical protein